MSKKKFLQDDEIANELQAFQSSEDEENENFSFNETNLDLDIDSALDRIQGITYEELLETLESSVEEQSHVEEFSCGSQIAASHHTNGLPMIEPSSSLENLSNLDTIEPQIDQSPMPGENTENDQEYYKELLRIYNELQNKQHQWSTNISNFIEHSFEKDLKCLITVSRGIPIHYFSKLFPDELIEILVVNTNKYAVHKKSKFWKNTNKEELSAFLGIFILMGLNPLTDFDLYWSSERFYNNQEISSIIPLKRF